MVKIISHPTLTTHQLLLRPFDAADGPEVYPLASDQRIASTTLRIPPPDYAPLKSEYEAQKEG